jgi:hypothetical protein
MYKNHKVDTETARTKYAQSNFFWYVKRLLEGGADYHKSLLENLLNSAVLL